MVANELGAPWRPQRYSDRFVALVAAAGLPPLVLHGSRHWAASLFADLGIPDVVAAAWLGQIEVATTRGYQDVMHERLYEASRMFGSVLTG